MMPITSLSTAKLLAVWLLLLLLQPLHSKAFCTSPQLVSSPVLLTIDNPVELPRRVTTVGITGRTAATQLQAVSPATATLAVNLGVDVLAASVTALCVAPLIAAFDEAITKSASGESNLWTALGRRLKQIVTQPATFFTSVAFQWMWIVYAATYVTTNALKSIETFTGLQFGFASTLAVTIVNMSCGIAKDSAYSKLFGCGDQDGCTLTPKKAYLVWFLRDVTAFTFILTLPTMVVRQWPRAIPLDVAKFTTPIVAQYVTTVLHLLGLNMCNNPDGTMGGWIKAIRPNNYVSTVAARQLRIIPPYSIGGILNGKLLSLAPLLFLR